MKNNLNKAFTLVELIVVITILAVLATVAFISFQGYSTESRDNTTDTTLILTGWRALDPKCPIDDIQIGNQVWAGCNSTLGNGFEWGKQNDGSNGTIGSCFNYDGTNNASDIDCVIGNSLMASDANPKDFFDKKQPDGQNSNNDSEFDTIWGKFYTWEQANTSACPAGWHLPSDGEWETLETYLNVGTNCRKSTDGWLCEGLGWNGHNTKNDSNNLTNALKIPLAGYRNTDGSTFDDRGYRTRLWSSTTSSAYAYRRELIWNYSTVIRYAYSQSDAFSVRCIKDQKKKKF